MRLKDLEERIEELKARASGRLPPPLVRAERGIAEVEASLAALDNHLAPAMRLTRVRVELDGVLVTERTGSDAAKTALFDGSIMPGQHTLTVRVDATADGHCVFTYADAYRFAVLAKGEVDAGVGATLKRTVRVFTKGDVTLSLAKRLRVSIVD